MTVASGTPTVFVDTAARLHFGVLDLRGSLGRALAEVFTLPTDAPAIARAVGRGERSAIGTWTFAGGGLVLEGGRRKEQDAVGPLLARLPFPSTWRAVVAVPHVTPWMTGAA